MTMKELRKEIQHQIDVENERYKHIKENDYVQRGLTLGKISGLQTALSYTFMDIGD